ncbi:acylneuraminate cytidylyltransferase family protein [Altibacter sp. HG106]|uniref:acylneuraminate cytidylyltransferase family protein n=1 Tax=Altibacter sp. HG106 TaxID=3023937 RepID=UPI0023501583|nr:acylneuraminate cytidylyltransferase family protein [Altibacter sp. HG106]MDC7995704.1 acylneuraminate cytidylyltransferase family protein [Altibacter sp. HG106]
MRILGLIPARAGSKGIPNKNKKLLGGKPLLQYTVEAALQTELLTDVVFSSEDESLRTLASSFGAQVLFERPEALATDSARSIDVVVHAVETLAALGKSYDAVCLLQVTTPFRTAKQIDEAVETFQSQQADSLISVTEVPHQYNPHWVFEECNKGKLTLATGEETIITRRQELPKAYIRNGAIYITATSLLLSEKTFYGKDITYVLHESDQSINIDTIADWNEAEQRVINSIK